MATDPRVCLNPHCETDDPVRSFLHLWYCSGACEYAHKRLLAVGPPRREDVVRVPVQDEHARVAESYRRLWNDVQVIDDIARKQAATNLVNAVWGASDPVGVPLASEWRVDP